MKLADNERLGLQSASSAYRRRRCVGSVALVNTLRDLGKLAPQLPDPDAASGTLVHAAWCGEAEAILQLNPMQLETARSLERLEKMVVVDWAGHDQYTLLGREKRLWLHRGLEPVHSGQFDVAYGTIATKRILILDGKTLFGEVLPAEENAQLQELVGLARFNFPAAQQFRVAILQPWVSDRVSIADYDQSEAEMCLRLLAHTLRDAADPAAPRTPGAWCKHCPALSQCEEAKTQLKRALSLAQRIKEGEYALPLGERGSQLLGLLAEVQTVTKVLRSRYKQLLAEDPDALPGWYLRPGKKVRAIPDVIKAYEIARDVMSLEEFFAAAELSIGPLEERLGKERFSQLFGPVIKTTQNAPELARDTRIKQIKDPEPNGQPL